MEDSYIGITQQLNIVKKAYSNIDAKYGPYDSIEDALAAIPISLRKEGLTVGVIIDNEIKEYWFNKGIENNNLILKTNPGVDLSEELENKVDKEPNAFLMTTTDRNLLYSLKDKQPTIIDGFWAFWDEDLQEYVKSEFSAVGDGSHSPYIDSETGTWFEWDPDTNTWRDTGIKAEGDPGKDAVSPIIIDGFWAFWDEDTQTFIKSSFSTVGDDGHSPYVGVNGNWYQWVPESGTYEDTGIKG